MVLLLGRYRIALPQSLNTEISQHLTALEDEFESRPQWRWFELGTKSVQFASWTNFGWISEPNEDQAQVWFIWWKTFNGILALYDHLLSKSNRRISPRIMPISIDVYLWIRRFYTLTNKKRTQKSIGYGKRHSLCVTDNFPEDINDSVRITRFT